MSSKPNRIREIRKERGVTLEQLAEGLGLSASYLSRLEKGTRQADLRHIVNIAKVLKCKPEELLPSDKPAMTSMNKVDEAVFQLLRTSGKSKPDIDRDIAYYLHGHATPPLEPVAINAIIIDVRGSVQAGHWTEAVEWPQDEWEYVTVPRPDGHKSYFGLKVKGPSMNKEYPEGAILVCVPIWDYRQAVESGDHVIVRRRNGDGRSEATVKELVIDEDGRYWLWPRSNHPEHQQPIEVPAANVEEYDAEGGDEIQVTAIVVADYRIRQRRKRRT